MEYKANIRVLSPDKVRVMTRNPRTNTGLFPIKEAVFKVTTSSTEVIELEKLFERTRTKETINR